MDRSLAHDVRGVIAAATSNIEFVHAQVAGELRAALDESMHELRVVADVIALLGSTGDGTLESLRAGQPLEVDLRAALMLERGEAAFAVDATGPPFLVRANPVQLATLARHLIAIAPRAGARTASAACMLAPVDPDGARALLRTAVLTQAGLKGDLSGSTLRLERDD